jgi:hypothetical protein
MSDTTVSPGFLGRTRGLLRRALRDVVDGATSLRGRTGLTVKPDLPDDDLARLQQQIDASLSGRGGEASARTPSGRRPTTRRPMRSRWRNYVTSSSRRA